MVAVNVCALPKETHEARVPSELEHHLELCIEATRSHFQGRHGNSFATDTKGTLEHGLGRACADGRLLEIDISSVQKQLGRLQKFLDGVAQGTVFFEFFGGKNLIRQWVSVVRLQPLGNARTVVRIPSCRQDRVHHERGVDRTQEGFWRVITVWVHFVL